MTEVNQRIELYERTRTVQQEQQPSLRQIHLRLCRV